MDHKKRPRQANSTEATKTSPLLKIEFWLQVYHHRPKRVRSGKSLPPLENLIPLMDPQKAPPGTHRRAPRPAQRVPRDRQARSRPPLETPLGPPRPPTNAPKTLSSRFKWPHSAKESAQSLPNATQEAPKPQNTMNINENHTFFVLRMAHP